VSEDIRLTEKHALQHFDKLQLLQLAHTRFVLRIEGAAVLDEDLRRERGHSALPDVDGVSSKTSVLMWTESVAVGCSQVALTERQGSLEGIFCIFADY
jgi:hypothetical protein